MTDIDSLWDYGDPAGSEGRFRAMLTSADSNPSFRLELLTQVARAQGLQRRFDDAHRTLDEADPLLQGAPVRGRARYLLERGRVHNSAGDPERARPCFEEALAVAETDPAAAAFAIDAAHMLAIVAPPHEALAWNLRALAMAEAPEDEAARRWRGSLLNNIGWSYHAAGNYPAAFDYLERALAFRRAHGPVEEERIARWCVARVRRDLGQPAVALAEQRALLAEYEALGRRSGYVYEEMAECLWLMGDLAAARSYFALAHAELAADPWLAVNEPARLERLQAMAKDE